MLPTKSRSSRTLILLSKVNLHIEITPCLFSTPDLATHQWLHRQQHCIRKPFTCSWQISFGVPIVNTLTASQEIYSCNTSWETRSALQTSAVPSVQILENITSSSIRQQLNQVASITPLLSRRSVTKIQ